MTGQERHLPNMDWISRVVLSPDRTLVQTTGSGNTLVLWETATGQERARLVERPRRPDIFFTNAFAPDGRTLASGSPDGVRLWELSSSKELACLEGHQSGVLSVAFSPDGARLVSAGLDTTALVWDISRHVRNRPTAADLKTEELEAQWQALAGKADSAHSASARLIAVPGQAVRLLRERVRPAPHLNERRLARLIADLDNDHFHKREQASAALEAMGEGAGASLRRALADATPEAGRRLRILLDTLEEEELRGLRCVELLERIGGTEARGCWWHSRWECPMSS